MQELISFIARSLVDNPDGVQVTVTEEDDTLVVDLAVDKDDLGKVIGKQGRTARAMRSLLSATAGKEDKKSRLNILE
ncbi:MAG: KH domain-containing protein [Proteobacteria bacterium]|nr:KH domain-containing protein [Pseudomonadota bacterium]MBU1234815.1 KH domain-containing protein [Pseudomonadota bacterium]MBU1419802.1 KH domain-containing protein [Pseudomonadota bacterium]MBU1456770.1 KH domain-containing protein [Pseudomonadota bacterium]